VCYTLGMPIRSPRHVVWERQQTEIWDRIFRVTQDVVTLAGTLDDSPSQKILQAELLKSAMAVGAELVRAGAADSANQFEDHVREARLKSIETDYWLRLVYVLQQRDEVQRDLANIIVQYSAIITLLQKFLRHTRGEDHVLRHHAKGPVVN
jgi:four helix bundle protein